MAPELLRVAASLVRDPNEAEISSSREPGSPLDGKQSELHQPGRRRLARRHCTVRVAGGSAAFRLVGLEPGRYRAVRLGDGTLPRGKFELPEGGDGALELHLSGSRRALPAAAS